MRVIEQIKDKNKKAIDLAGYCRRSFIIALARILTEYDGMPNLVFKIGKTTINFKKKKNYKKVRQHGNFKMVIPSLGKFHIRYGKGLITRLDRLLVCDQDTNANKKERKERFLNFIKNGFSIFKPFTSTNLK